MSILEPQLDCDAEDPLLDAVLGLYSFAHRARATLERVAPELAIDDVAERESLPEPLLSMLLGIVATSDALERSIEASAPIRETPSAPSARASAGGSLWR